ncbi:MAG: UDP-3-O-(3-hydroxymyristoyl)glucosamine N-acyltransferase [Pseudomonadota bacterium]|nr:UDP-3-O-(3-hydroxymyristoyl)glucosamine N-acyltransferase [Pseudomonadota bacterium]
MRLPVPTTAAALAVLTGGTLAGPDRVVTGVAPLDRAGPDDLTFLARGAAGCAGVHLARAALPDRTTIVVADPLAALVTVLAVAFPDEASPPSSPASLEHPGAFVHPTARVGTATLHSGVVVGADCVVGDETVLFPHVVLYPRTRIGRNVRVHANAVLGADGFRYHPTVAGLVRVPHVAGVAIGDHVEIGPGCTIDRGFLVDTTLGDGCRLDALVHVGHNVTLGRMVLVAAQTGLSGSVVIGDGAVLGGQVGVADHAVIGAGARIGAQSGVHGRIPAGEAWLGTPALPLAITRRVYATLRHLPELWRRHRPDGD